MNFNMQTEISGEGTIGNCVQAAVSSILGLEMNEVPHFLRVAEIPEEWELVFRKWMTAQGFHIVNYGGEWQFPGLYLASGPTKRNPNIWHMVVMRDGKLVHDPHPDNIGLSIVKHIKLLVPLEPQIIKE